MALSPSTSRLSVGRRRRLSNVRVPPPAPENTHGHHVARSCASLACHIGDPARVAGVETVTCVAANRVGSA